MRRLDFKPKHRPQIDHRQAVLSLRWLVVILASYLTLFGYIATPVFPVVTTAAIAFAMSNVVLSIIPRHRFIQDKIQRAVAVLDVVFISVTLYLLRVSENYLYIAFIVVVVLAVLWRDLRLVLFALLVVSVLYGAFNYFRLFRFELDVNIEQFLALALFFVVSIFYIFLSEQLMHDEKLSTAIIEQNRVAGEMVEITRALS